MRLVLDTSAYSHMRSGHEGVLERVAKAESVLLPTTVLGELEAAFRLGRRTEENRTVLEEFLGEPFVAVIAVTPDVAAVYGRLFAALRRAGTPVPLNDIWIAAAEIDVGAHLLTLDRDFERIGGLERTVLAPEA